MLVIYGSIHLSMKPLQNLVSMFVHFFLAMALIQPYLIVMVKLPWMLLLVENYVIESCVSFMFNISYVAHSKKKHLLDEYNGYSTLDAAYQGDLSRLKKFLSNETILFRHFKTGDSPLVC